jgi:ADP-heptose:LPS heptosyltransferase
MPHDRQAEAQSILAIHPGALGDVILFGHLLSRLAGSVTLVSGGEKGRLLAGAGVVARALDFEALPMHEVFADTAADKCRLPGLLGKHDRLISCFADGDRRAELRLAAMCGCSDAAFLPVRPPEDFRGHLLDLWSDLLGLPPARGKDVRPWRIPAAWRKSAAAELRKAGLAPRQPYLAIHPGSGSAGKCWKLENFVEFAARVNSPERLNAVFVVGPVELECWEAGTIQALARRFVLLRSPELKVLAGLLASAEAYLGNDSGVSHLAAATGVKTTVLFGPSRKEHFEPLGRAVRTIVAGKLADIGVAEVLSTMRFGTEPREYS